MMKKIVKYIGNICVIIALVIIIKKLSSYDIDYNVLFQPGNIALLVLLSAIYGVFVWLCSFPWKKIIEVLTDKQIDWRVSSKIATKANLMKYLPGNVFQYVGRNELAVVCDLNHVQVASATVIDVLINLSAVVIMVVVLYYEGLLKWIEYYGIGTFRLVFIGSICLIIILFLAFVFRNKIKFYLESYGRLFKKNGIKVLVGSWGFYTINNICMSFLYIAILVGIVHTDVTANFVLIIGAFILSWLMGFIVPGAPGGIGIRETVLTLLLGTSMQEEAVLLAIVIFRIVSTIGDLIGYGIAHITSRKQG